MEHVTDRHLVLFMALSTPRWGARFRREPAPEAPDVEPSAREREIVRLVALGASGPEIADEQAVRELLERRGYGVVGEAAGAASALAEAARVRPDTVLLDVHLPDKSGLDVCTALCSARPAPAVLLVSMYELPGQERHVEACGACGFVPKHELAITDQGAFWPTGTLRRARSSTSSRP